MNSAAHYKIERPTHTKHINCIGRSITISNVHTSVSHPQNAQNSDEALSTLWVLGVLTISRDGGPRGRRGWGSCVTTPTLRPRAPIPRSGAGVLWQRNRSFDSEGEIRLVVVLLFYMLKMGMVEFLDVV